jgi:ubiquinone/menaquinone biosynthesis C-methylase UbiE
LGWPVKTGSRRREKHYADSQECRAQRCKAPDLVVRDGKKDTYTVPYGAVNAMLLNEFLKECRKVDAQAGELIFFSFLASPKTF